MHANVVLAYHPKEDGSRELIFDLQARDIPGPRGAPVGQANELLPQIVGVDPDLVGGSQVHRGGDVPNPRRRPFQEVLVLTRQEAQVHVELGPVRGLGAQPYVPVLEPVGPGEGDRVHRGTGVPLDGVTGEKVRVVLEGFREKERAQPPSASEGHGDAVVVFQIPERTVVEQVVVPRPVDAEGHVERPALHQRSRLSVKREAVAEAGLSVVGTRDEAARSPKVGVEPLNQIPD